MHYIPSTYNDKSVILIQFEYNPKLIAEIRQWPGCRWSRTQKSWYVPDNAHYREKFGLPLKQVSKNVLSKISEINQPALKIFREQIELRNYSPHTLKTYCNEFAQLLYILKGNNVNNLNSETVKSYLLFCLKELKLTENQLHSRFNAIKFYFEKVLNREKIFMDIPRPKKPSQLPKIIHSQDIKKIFSVTENLKHNTMLKLCYGMGLRVSEIANLKITDIDSKNMQVLIERAKGKKDRYVNLPESILEQLRKYYIEYKPKEYLFEGQYGGQYSIRSIQQVFKGALKKAKINKQVGIHSLRHSYATHLLENGTDISYIQKLLGHNDIKTTLVYTRIGNKDLKKVKSPLDNL